MSINRDALSAMMRSVADLWQQNVVFLSEIDSRFGDGDHGVTIGKVAALIQSRVDAWDDKNIEEFLKDLGEAIMAISGGSAGPLYGTMIEGLSGPLGDCGEIDGPLLKAMFAASRDALFELTKARQGDKTMMDALIPAVSAAEAASDDPAEILRAASEAAEEGERATEEFVSRFGRARSYGEQTLGTRDAGAVSTSLFFQGLAKGFEAL